RSNVPDHRPRSALRVYFDACLVFFGYRHHRDLHSFPTRRSSDLAVLTAFACTGSALSSSASAAPQRRHNSSALLLTNPQTNYARSEEHTSELQSPCNLVCRLLLEKKKSVRTPNQDRYYPLRPHRS